MTSTDAPASSARAFALLVGFLTIAGCGGADGFRRFPVEGTITLDGSPLESGTITFIPQGQGATSSAEVVDGTFRLGQSDGLSPGPYRVEIFSIRPTGKKIPSADDPGTLVEETTNLVPLRYNVRTELRTEIPAQGPGEPLTFVLTSAREKKTRR